MKPRTTIPRPSTLTAEQATAIVTACTQAGLPELAVSAIQGNVTEVQLNQHLKTAAAVLAMPEAQQAPRLCKLVATTFGRPDPRAILKAAIADRDAAITAARSDARGQRLSVFKDFDESDDIKAQVGDGGEIERIYAHRHQQTGE